MTHKPYSLKKISTSIAIVCTALVLVGCGSSSSSSSRSVTSTPNPLVSDPAFNRAAAVLNFDTDDRDAPALQGTNHAGSNSRFSQAVQFTNAIGQQTNTDSGIISHSSVIRTKDPNTGSAADDVGDTVDNLIVILTDIDDDNGDPLYSIDYARHDIFDTDSAMTATTSAGLTVMSNAAAFTPEQDGSRGHTTFRTNNIGDLKLSALSASSIGSSRQYHLEIYTNHGEDNPAGGTFGDTNYLVMGTWIDASDSGGNGNVGTFVHGADAVPTAMISGLTSTPDATYIGTAVGLIAVGDINGSFAPVYADVNLDVDFNDGSLSGTINRFIIRGNPNDFSAITTSIGGQIYLNEKTIANEVGGFSSVAIGAAGNRVSTLTFNGASHNYVGYWSSQFYGALDAANQPPRAAGTVVAATDAGGADFTGLYLSFGANKLQQP